MSTASQTQSKSVFKTCQWDGDSGSGKQCKKKIEKQIKKSFKRLKAPNFSNFEWIAYQSGEEWAPWAALVIKNPPANAGDIREMGQTLGGEDPLEEGMATHSSILPWRIQWTEEPSGLQFIGLQRVGND